GVLSVIAAVGLLSSTAPRSKPAPASATAQSNTKICRNGSASSSDADAPFAWGICFSRQHSDAERLAIAAPALGFWQRRRTTRRLALLVSGSGAGRRA